MPSKYTIRNFYNDGYYHVYNRGVEKRNIFEEKRDYLVFIYYLGVLLTPPELIDKDHEHYKYSRSNYADEVSLFAYCLMPNHFHLFLRQDKDEGVTHLMKALSNAYTEYFNKKNDRTGGLFQGKYKAAEVDNDGYYLHLSKYIHQNPKDIGKDPLTYEYSSVLNYVDTDSTAPVWLKSDEIVKSFGNQRAYLEFMRSNGYAPADMLGDITID